MNISTQSESKDIETTYWVNQNRTCMECKTVARPGTLRPWIQLLALDLECYLTCF